MDTGFLCIGGIEVVNHCRTLGYLRTLGMPGLQRPPDFGSTCCCGAASPGEYNMAVEIGFDLSDPRAGLGGLLGTENVPDGAVFEVSTVTLSGPQTRPALPGAGAWSAPTTFVFPEVPTVDALGYGHAPTNAVFGRYKLSLGGDPVFTVYVYFSGNAFHQNDPAGSEVSFDGVTWLESSIASFKGSDYTTPAMDDAPWYDPLVPESNDFLGVWVEELLTPTAYDRKMRPTQRGGSASAARWGPREIHVTGLLLARSVRGAAYGREWLMEALIDGNCSSGCSLPDLTMYRTCCGDDTEGEVRTAKGVALIGAPNWTLDPMMPREAGCKFEFTLQAQEPFFYREPEQIAAGLVYDLIADAECNFCSGCPDDTSSIECTCGSMMAPQRFVGRDQSADDWCSPLLVRRRYVPVPPTKSWTTAAAIVKIKVGTLDSALGGRGLANLRLRAFANPLGLDGPLVTTGDGMIDYRSYFICSEPCMSIEVSCLPPDSELVIDATTRTATLTCGNVTNSGYPYLSSNSGAAFRWPELDCSGLMIVIEADDQNTPPDTTFEVLTVARDRS